MSRSDTIPSTRAPSSEITIEPMLRSCNVATMSATVAVGGAVKTELPLAARIEATFMSSLLWSDGRSGAARRGGRSATIRLKSTPRSDRVPAIRPRSGPRLAGSGKMGYPQAGF